MYHVSFPALGWEFTVNRVAFTIFGQNIYWYGVLIATGMALAMLFAFYHAKTFGLDEDKMADVIMVGAIGAIVGLRLFYVAFSPVKYDSFWDMINIRDGGLAIYGGIIGAFVSGALACKWRKMKVLPMIDIASIGFLIGQSIGRWGNFTNQEVFGTNTTLPWGMISEGTTHYLASVQSQLAAQGMMVDPQLPVHPTFLYESLWCALGFIFLYFFIKRRKYDGQMALIYIAWYGTGRAYIESIRADSLLAGSVRVSLMIGLCTAVVAIALLIYFAKTGKTGLWVNEMEPLAEAEENMVTKEEEEIAKAPAAQNTKGKEKPASKVIKRVKSKDEKVYVEKNIDIVVIDDIENDEASEEKETKEEKTTKKSKPKTKAKNAAEDSLEEVKEPAEKEEV